MPTSDFISVNACLPEVSRASRLSTSTGHVTENGDSLRRLTARLPAPEIGPSKLISYCVLPLDPPTVTVPPFFSSIAPVIPSFCAPWLAFQFEKYSPSPS